MSLRLLGPKFHSSVFAGILFITLCFVEDCGN